MKTDTLLFKLLTVILASFAITASVVLFLGKKQLVEVIDESRSAEFDERLSAIVRTLAQQETRLKTTGREEAYREDFQAMAVKTLKAAYYNRSGKARADLFVVDQAGNMVMRPEQETTLLRSLPTDRLREGGSGEFIYKTAEGTEVWCIHRTFAPWDWTAFYLMTVQEKHAAASAYGRMLLAITFLMVAVVSIVLYFLVKRQTQPITDLTRASEAMRLGDYSHPLPGKASGESLVLAKAFESMRQTVQDNMEALRRSEERLQLATRAAGIGIWDWDIINNILIWDDDMYRLYGIRQSDFGGAYEAWSRCLHPEDKERTEGEIQAALHGEREYAPEFRIVWPDGSIHFITAASKTFRNEQGKPVRMIGTNIDISERKRAEEEIQHLKNYLANIINSMPSVLIGVDTAGSVTQWNIEAERSTGIAADKAAGRQLGEVAPYFATKMEQIRQSINQRSVVHDAKVAMPISGQIRYSDVTIYPLVANCVEGAVIRIDDVTERVRLEEMMIQTEKMMSVGGLAAGMAHEINNPLAGIMQNLQLLEMYLLQDTPKNRRLAEECGLSYKGLQQLYAKRGISSIIASVIDSGARAAKIVGNMLSFSRKTDKGFTENDIAELLDNTVELAANDYDLKKRYDFRQIEIVREYGPAPKVQCEASQIQQVFLNILKNGAQAMAGYTGADNDRRSRFALRVKPAENAVRIEIADNGPGMDEATRKRVFEPFFTTKEVGVGTGLGMSVSYFIVTENHGGSIDVESKPGEGANFIVTLPVRKGETRA